MIQLPEIKPLPHVTVLLDETIYALAIQPGDVVIDCTVGGGGHTERLAQSVGPSGQVIGLDRDSSALELAIRRLREKKLDDRVELVHAPFSHLAKVVKERNLTGKIAAIVADIGVSSMHLDDASRGFSFQGEGPLDMRMDTSQDLTAERLVNESSEEALFKIFRELGEEPKARIIARKIVEARREMPFKTTRQLAEFLKAHIHYPTHSRKHPATRVFQALRIAVNDELGQLLQLLQDSLTVLKSQGRLAVISFHSLEDRLVKEFFVDISGKRHSSSIPRDLPISAKDMAILVQAKGKIIKPFPIIPKDEEILENPRSRSAKLRVVSKI